MEFLDFCRAHGILINNYPPMGLWRRFPTETKPHHRNGAVKFMGDIGYVCDWASGDEVHIWKSDSEVKYDRSKALKLAQEAERKRKELQDEAARKARLILSECQIAKHPYLEKKGFPDEQGYVWRTDKGLILVIPMRIGRNLVGCQMIDEAGEKKFLYGQRTGMAQHIFDAKGPDILCEGFATALSVKAALKALKRPYTLHVCFSAGNMVKVAASLPGGYVVADNDASQTGQEAAKKIGWPCYVPPNVGDDFNDHAMKVGAFRASRDLLKMFTASGL